MNKIYTQHFTFTSTHEISLSDSIIDDGNYILEITNLEDKKDYQRLELTKEEVVQLHKLTGLFQTEVDKEAWKKSDMLYTIGHDPYKEELKIIQLHTTDKYLGKWGRQIEFTAQTDSKNLRVTSLLKTEWVDLPLLRIIKIEEDLYKTKKITCVLQTGDMTAYIPDEILDPNTQVNRDTIPLEIINFEQ